MALWLSCGGGGGGGVRATRGLGAVEKRVNSASKTKEKKQQLIQEGAGATIIKKNKMCQL